MGRLSGVEARVPLMIIYFMLAKERVKSRALSPYYVEFKSMVLAASVSLYRIVVGPLNKMPDTAPPGCYFEFAHAHDDAIDEKH